MQTSLRKPFEDPSPANLAKSVIDEFAAKVAGKVGYEPGADLEKIVFALGGIVLYDSWDNDERGGSLEVYPGENPSFVIRVASFAGNLRNRFTIAHELGHYFLHSKGGKRAISVARAGSGRIEWEANWFAGAFLLPAEQFKRDWKKFGNSIARIVSVYKVSETVVKIRLENLEMK